MFGALGAGNVLTESWTESTNVRLLTGLGLAGAAGGVLVASAIRSGTRVNVADATVFTTTTTIASLAPMAVLLAASAEVDGTVLSVATMAGIAGGMALGTMLIRDVNHSENGASYYPLGAVAGGLLGLGVGLTFEAEEWTPTIALVGAAAGLALIIVSQEARDESFGLGNIEFDVNPLGALLAQRANVPVPVARMQLRF